MLLAKTAHRAKKLEPGLVGLMREAHLALWGLLRQPRYSVPAALSVALGVGASLAVFAVFSALMLRPLPFPEEERLVQVGFPGASEFSAPDVLTLSRPLIADFRQHRGVFESLTGHEVQGGRLQLHGQPLQWVSTQKVELDFFDTLGINALRGQVFSARAPGSSTGVVMRHGYWLEELGGKLQIGEALLLDGLPRTFIGTIADEQALANDGSVWAVPDIGEPIEPWSFYSRAYARLAPGVTLEEAQRRMLELTEDLEVKNRAGDRLRIQLQPLRQNLVDTERSWLSLMVAAVFSFLLMSCANLAALLATRASVRRHELAVCAALGATRGVLARQSVMEGFVLAALSGVVGLGLAQLGVDWANREYAQALGNLPARLDWRVLSALFGLVLVCTMAGSAAPVLASRKVTSMDALRAQGRASEGQGAGRLRKGLVVVQVAATAVLLINAGLLLRSLQELLSRDTGFSTEGVVLAKVILKAPPRDGTRESFFAQKAEVERQGRAALERVRAIDGVRGVGVGRVPFDYAIERGQMQVEPGAKQPEVNVRLHHVGPGYFETLGIERLSGQPFGPEHDAWPPQRHVIVSRNFALEVLGVPDAVGHRVRFKPPPNAKEPPAWIQIIGMVEDAIDKPFTDPTPFNVYFPFFAYPNRLENVGNVPMSLALSVPTETEQVLGRLPAAVAEVLPTAPVAEIKTFRSLVRSSLGRRLALCQVLSALAAVALILAAIGLAGIASYSVARRFQELAIRRMLGATERGIRLMVLRETGSLVAAGTVLGMVAAWFSRHLMTAFLQGIAPIDPVTYLAVSAGALLITVGAAWIATRPIAKLSPAQVLARH